MAYIIYKVGGESIYRKRNAGPGHGVQQVSGAFSRIRDLYAAEEIYLIHYNHQVEVYKHRCYNFVKKDKIPYSDEEWLCILLSAVPS